MELITADLSVNTIRRVIINVCIHVSGRERVKLSFQYAYQFEKASFTHEKKIT